MSFPRFISEFSIPFRSYIRGNADGHLMDVAAGGAANSIRVFGGWTLQIQMGPISVMSYEASQLGDHAAVAKRTRTRSAPDLNRVSLLSQFLGWLRKQRKRNVPGHRQRHSQG